MKPVIVFVAAFVVATAASTGAKVVLTKPAHVAADSTHADSTKAGARTDSSRTAPDSTKSTTDTAIVASGQATPAPAEAPPVAAAPATAATVTPAPVAAAPVTSKADKLESAVAQATAAAAANDTVVQASERRIAKVFTSMDAKQAAKVLEHMTDNDVHVILGYVGVKQAAQIMAALPPERVAKLSKLSMGSR